MIKHFCDRCGNEIPKDGLWTYVITKDQCGDRLNEMKPEYELCFDCKDRLKEFLEAEDGK